MGGKRGEIMCGREGRERRNKMQERRETSNERCGSEGGRGEMICEGDGRDGGRGEKRGVLSASQLFTLFAMCSLVMLPLKNLLNIPYTAWPPLYP